MSLSRYAKKRDTNEREIIDALEKCGCSVQQLDCVDLLVERAGKLFLLEVKVDGKAKLTDAQREFRKRFTFHVVLCPEDALAIVGLLDLRARVTRRAREVERQAAAVVAGVLLPREP